MWAAGILILSLFIPVSALADEALDIDTRDGVTVRMAIVAPSAPKGVALLFSGAAENSVSGKMARLRMVVISLFERGTCSKNMGLLPSFLIRRVIGKKEMAYAVFGT